ncbi:MAG: phthalate 4,5-dioxygenase [Chloroflexi bacterium]|nr:phthalate 4,5-dioxygenase [Chloroflexota bacterium]
MSLTQEENDTLTRVGPGTPAGEMLRRYWQPAALIEELPTGGAPLPIRLLGEDLVLFRDEQGYPGLLGIHCSHRGADLSYGRVEDGGLRCIYHGWLYDIAGRCLEQPGEPPGSSFHKRVRQRAYPCREAGGMILAYMGPDEPPLVPAYEFLTVADEQRYNSKIFQECNYLQANEGNLDPVHVPFLHRIYARHNGPPPSPAPQRVDITFDVEMTDWGVRLTRMDHPEPGVSHARFTNFVFPNFSAIPAGSNDGYTVNWHVPIDDEHHWKYVTVFRRDGPVDPEAVRRNRADLTDGYRLRRNRGNRYGQDREEMRTKTLLGIGTDFQDHDALATEGEGAIQDRTQEHLASSDRAVVMIRHQLMQAIRQVQSGGEAPHVVRDPAANHFPSLVVFGTTLPESADWRQHMREVIAASERGEDPASVGADSGEGMHPMPNPSGRVWK